MASPGVEDRTPRRKYKGKGGDEAEDHKRRGRPRVDGQDETAADRRRTQIRMAQRAYRMRKETTIASLKTRVETLQNTVDEMNGLFLSFNDRIMSTGVLKSSPELTRELRRVTEQFIVLAKNATGDPEDDTQDDVAMQFEEKDQPPQEDITALLSARSAVPRTTRKPTKLNITNSRDPSLSSFGSESPAYAAPCPLQTIAESLELLPSTSVGTSKVLSITREQQQWRVELPQMPHPFSFPSLQSPPPTAGIGCLAPLNTSVFSASLSEPTFARRLLRAAFEGGYTLILNSHLTPRAFAHSFKLSLAFFTREQLLSRFETFIRNGVIENSEYWRLPYVTVGNSGSHYPERDAYGNIVPKRNLFTLQLVDWPRSALARLISVDGCLPAPEELIDVSGFEGEWLDVHDVEGYLQERGLFIPTGVEYAEGDIVDIPTSLAPRTPQNTDFQMPGLAHDIAAPGSAVNSPDLGPGSASSMLSASPPDTPPQDVAQDFLQGIEFLEGRSNDVLDGLVDPFSGASFDIPDRSGDMSADYPNVGLFSKPASESSMLSGLGAATMLPGQSPFAGSNVSSSSIAATPSKSLQRLKSRHVIVDVGRFIREAMRDCICLGRSPGFRRSEVDRALNEAIVEAY